MSSMMSLRAGVAALVAWSALAGAASAQEAVVEGAPVATEEEIAAVEPETGPAGQTAEEAIETIAPKPLQGPAPVVPPELASQGVQGAMRLSGTVGLDGVISGVVVVVSSGSEALDAAGVATLKQWSFTPGSTNGEPVVASVEVPVQMYKDTTANLGDKTCADLNVDVAYYRSISPDGTTKDMRLRKLSSGLLYITSNNKLSVDNLKKVTGAFDKTVAWCETHPDKPFLKRLFKEAR